MPRTFILIAHRSGARLFKQDHVHAPLALHTQFDFPKGRLQEGEINADRPGRVHDRMGNQRHGVSREESAVDHLTAGFVRELADYLRTARLAKDFDHLVLVAGPKLLGRLREALDADTLALVTASLHKDLQDVPERELPAHLAEAVAFA
jgi:protein required for attachment to host cells